MTALTANPPRPVDIRLHQASRVLEISFDDDTNARFSCEFLRVYSPSAEVRGHGAGQEVLQMGKEEVNIVGIEPVGHYAVKLVFRMVMTPGCIRGTTYTIWLKIMMRSGWSIWAASPQQGSRARSWYE